MCSKIPFIIGMAAGIAVGSAVGVMSQSRTVKVAGKKFMRTPAGRVVKSVAGMIEQL